MRIGIDAREMCGKPTGVGRHLSGLLSAWATDPAASRHVFVLYAPEAIAPPLKNAEVRVVPGFPGTVWEQLSLPAAARHDRLNVFFAPGYTAPLLLNVPSVVLVHDISFVAHPEWFRWKEGLRRRTLTRWSSRHAALVLTVSEAARREILSHFGLAADRVRRIYPGVASPGQHRTTQGTGGPANRVEPLVLFVGSVFNRRHLPDLIRAFRPIAGKAPTARLEIVGDNRTYPYEDLAVIARMEGLESRITIRPYISDTELGDLYGRARAFALLSEYEGFGHPPLEALAAGVPPVLLDTSVAREVCGDAAVYVPNHSPDVVTGALDELLFHEAVRARVLHAGASVLARYEWPRAASETLAALESVA